MSELEDYILAKCRAPRMKHKRRRIRELEAQVRELQERNVELEDMVEQEFGAGPTPSFEWYEPSIPPPQPPGSESTPEIVVDYRDRQTH